MRTKIFLFLVLFLLYGCTAMGGWSQVPSVVVHRYDYQAQPPALSPGTPPSPPTEDGPAIVDYRTVYQESSGSNWNDPTLVVFKNEGYLAKRLSIDGQPEIRLAGYQATADIHLAVGGHRVRVVVEKPTRAHGTLEVVRFIPISVRPEGWAKVIPLYDY